MSLSIRGLGINALVRCLAFILLTAACAGDDGFSTTSSTTTSSASSAIPAGSGQVVFWVPTEVSEGANVTIGGTTITTATPFATAPACGSTGAATFTLPAGTYDYIADSRSRRWTGTVTIVSGQCINVALDNRIQGTVSFWLPVDPECGKITIEVSKTAVTNFIHGFGTNTAVCSGNVNATIFNLDPGTFQYTARCLTNTWSGTFDVVAGKCTFVELKNPVTVAGKITFWTTINNVTIKAYDSLNSGTVFTKTIAQPLTSAPSCGAAGTTTILMPPGRTKFTATSADGLTWVGAVTIVKDQCQVIALTEDNAVSTVLLVWAPPGISLPVTVKIREEKRGTMRTGTVTQSLAAKPTCTATAGALALKVPYGRYSIIASNDKLGWAETVDLGLPCTDYKLRAGKVQFWTPSTYCGNIAVTFAGQTKTITRESPSPPAACELAGNATFEFGMGVFQYTATCSGKTITGSILMSADECISEKLDFGGPPAAGPDGQVVFWTKTNFNCGNITVNISGNPALITNTFPSAPGCGTSGAATFKGPPGIYNFTASCTGKTWSGAVTITSNTCGSYELTSGAPSGGGGGTCSSMNSLVTSNSVWKNICGTADGLSVTVTNNSNQRLAIQIAIKRLDGTWDCGVVTPQPGASAEYWTCRSTGESSFRSLPYDDWITKCTFSGCPI